MYKEVKPTKITYEIEINEDSIEQSCYACPAIYDFEDIDGDEYYFRLRHGVARLSYTSTGETLAQGNMHGFDGSCSWDEAFEWMQSNGIVFIE